MDLSAILALIGAVFGGGVIATLVFYGVEKRLREEGVRKANAEAHKVNAEAGAVEAATQNGIIKNLWAEISRLSGRLESLEGRVTALEAENSALRRAVERFRSVVAGLWGIIVDNEVEVYEDLAQEVCAILQTEAGGD